MLLALAMAAWTTRARKRRSALVPISYRDASGSGVWCTFETGLGAMEAAQALNDAYAGAKTFWVSERALRQARDYLGTAPRPVALAEPLPAPRPKTRPKPGTPVVRQINGQWRVQVGAFEIGYGSGEAGYRAALDAVRQAHQQQRR